jgi:DNA-directed RNA polymerase specialized sigma24 family protein
MEKTDVEVQSAYSVARRIAKSVMRKVSTLNSNSMGFEDFVQEGMMAWLEGKSMYYGMIDAFRSQAKMSSYSYTTKGMKEPEVLLFNDEIDGATDEAAEICNRIDAERILKRIQAVDNEQQQFALLGYLYFGMSLREIGTVLEKSHEWVRTYLVEPELKKIREEFKC